MGGGFGGQSSSGYGSSGYGGGYGSSGYGGRFGQRRSMRRGPKGYERSDERLKEDISERMYANEDFDVSDVSIEVANGVVTLDGNVDDRYSKYMLEEMVDSIPGVKDVDNRLRIRRGDESRSSGESGSSGSSMSGTGSRSSSSGSDMSGSGRSSRSESGSGSSGSSSSTGSSSSSATRRSHE